ncbi:putative membrane protein [Aliivibrio salmonicida LFI1238]|uniref:Membrane protein n=1 Tax=Aliivibrio salmonicida (strain LFI1238) TaxID=316275 RepID=B6ENF3_ALISL|nr:putative membrane protein [Aliivibrio salmonicida LFI1238]
MLTSCISIVNIYGIISFVNIQGVKALKVINVMFGIIIYVPTELHFPFLYYAS